MSRLPIQNVESATGSNKDIFAAPQKGLGMVPNMARVMANSPAVLQSWVQFNGALGTAKLSPQIREQIALLTAENNACTYCLSAHSTLGKMVGLIRRRSTALGTLNRPIPAPLPPSRSPRP